MSAPIVIVGMGPVGIQAARELLQRSPRQSLVLYDAEAWEPYNRVRLSELLGGEIEWQHIRNPLRLPAESAVALQINNPVSSLDRNARVIAATHGDPQPYSKVILATGSRPHVPPMANARLLGVYTYRNLSDAQTLMTNALQTRCTVVLGGGVLGVEVAYALKRQNRAARVVIVHRNQWLLDRQLDPESAEVLRQHLTRMAIDVQVRSGVRRVLGEHQVAGVELVTGGTVECDTLVICTGIVPNVQIAVDAGLRVGRGVRVDDHLRTSDPDIYAIGECAEHRGHVYGLVGPGIEQARVAVDHLLGGNSRYVGSHRFLRAALADLPVLAFERSQDRRNAAPLKEIRYADPVAGRLRKLFVRHGRLARAVAVGAWDELERLQDAVARGAFVWPWRARFFRREGRLWSEALGEDPRGWPDAAPVCGCAGITCGQVVRAAAQGHTSLDAIREHTGAGQACGSCWPLLRRLATAPEAAPARPLWRPLVYVSIAALVVAVALLAAPPLPGPRSAMGGPSLARWWTDPAPQQATGYACLALALASLGLSVRKRWTRFRAWDVPTFRLVHGVLALAALLALALHTGLRLGAGFNLGLLATFVGATVAGVGLTGAAAASESIGGARLWPVRAILFAIHLGVVWLLPALVAIHVLAVYYF